MEQKIDLKETVYQICTKYPAAKEILVRAGFRELAKPGMLDTVGKFMTIPRGASMQGVPLAQAVAALEAGGFTVAGAESGRDAPAADGAERERRAGLLREYVDRLSRGDSLDAVRADFAANFRTVDAAEIAGAEQALIEGGTPVAEVQRLCDVHSALFHGATREERIAGAERAVSAGPSGTPLSQIAGHPAAVLRAENAVIRARLEAVRRAASSGDGAVREALNALRAAAVHYTEKGDLLYPLLKSKYGVSGPADVMWGVDDEIRYELNALAAGGAAVPQFAARLEKLLDRAEEMVYKEDNILLPLCAQNFSEEDWMRISYELPAYDDILPGGRPVWAAAEARRAALTAGKKGAAGDERIPLGSGHLTPAQIEAVLNTIPMELTFIDEQDVNRFFNAGKKLFRRPDEAVDREVYDCHPPKYAAMARQIIASLKSGAKDSVDVWLTKRGEPVFVRYMAVRSRTGEYVGTLECVQKMGFAAAHFREPNQA